MKRLYLIGGTMGIGKTTVCRELQKRSDRCVFLDGDWCWDMHPFQVTEETKRMVMDNICFLLNNFLKCSAYETVLFCWVMHEQSILDEILERLNLNDCRVTAISLVGTEEELKKRLCGDIAAGRRTPDILERSAVRLELYGRLNTVKVNVTGKSIEETAEEILSL